MRMSRKRRRERQRREKTREKLVSIAKKGLGITAAAMFFWSSFLPSQVQALPSSGQVVVGNAVINQNGNLMNINQLTNKAAINWHSFSIAANEKVNFNQPNANAVLLNRVIGNDPSKIFGQMNANGKVFLVNPNGVLFAPGAQVNVGGLLATTHSISDSDFIAGNYKFISSNTDGKVINQGTIIAENQGIVALLAPEAINEGVIIAQKGSVAIASANQATFDFTGDGKMQLVVNESTVKALAENRGIIEADGGIVLMTASAQRELASAVINQSGIIRATSLDGKAGSVELNAAGGTANVSGTIDASGLSSGAKGGTVDIFAGNINLENYSKIDASGDTGGGKVRIGGDWQGSGDAPHAQNVGIAQGAVINADAITQGDGGTVVAWSDGLTKFDGYISAKGGKDGGDGGQVETSGHVLQINGDVNASAANGNSGEWLLDPADINIVGPSNPNEPDGAVVEDSGNYMGAAGSGTSYVKASTVSDVLDKGTNVTIKTSTTPGGGAGNITVSGDILKTNALNENSNGDNVALNLEAVGQIIVDANITSNAITGGKLDVNLTSGVSGSTTITINAGKSISTNGGNVTIKGSDSGEYANAYGTASPIGVNILGAINTGTGNITVRGSSSITSNNATVGVAVGNGGSLTSTGGNIVINGTANNSGTNASAVKIDGVVNAGSGTVTITGVNENSAGAGIWLDNNAAVNAKDVSLAADKMNFVSGAKVQGSGTLVIAQYTAGRGVTIGGADPGDTLYLGSGLFSGTPVFQDFSNAIVGREGLGSLTVAGATTFGTDTTLQSDVIGINAATTSASGKKLTLKAKTSASNDSSGSITADTLDLQGATFNLNNAAGDTNVKVLTGNAQNVNFANNGDFSVGSDTENGLEIAGDSTLSSNSGTITIKKNIEKTGTADATLTVNTGAPGDIIVGDNAKVQLKNGASGKLNISFNSGKDINIKQNAALNSNGVINLTSAKNLTINNATLNSNNNDINLTATDGEIKLTGGSAAVNSGTGNITFHSKTLSVLDNAGATRGGTVTGTGTLTIDTSTPGGTIGVGGGSGTLQIDTAAFGATAADSVFIPGFGKVVIGSETAGNVNIGELTSQSELLIKSGGTITFATGANLQTNNEDLTLDAWTVDFANSSTATISAGSGDLIFNADTINNWSKVSFGASSKGNLVITPKTSNRTLQIGGSSVSNTLSVDSDAFKEIDLANFKSVIIGSDSDSGEVNVGSFTLETSPANIFIVSPSGGATIADGSQVLMRTGGTLGFRVKSLTQTGSSASSFEVKNLLLEGNSSTSGNFVLNKAGTKITNLAANPINGDLTVVNDANTELVITTLKNKEGFDVKGIDTGTGSIELVADSMKVLNKVSTTGSFTIYSKTKDINIGGSDKSGLFLDAGYFNSDGVLSGNYGSLSIGKSGFDKNINIGDVTFASNSDLSIVTDGDATVNGALKTGKDLIIDVGGNFKTWSTIETKKFNLKRSGNGIAGIGGKVKGSGDFSITVTKVGSGSTQNTIYFTNENKTGLNEGDYILKYDVLNNQLEGFDKVTINGGTNVVIEDGSLNKALDLTTNGSGLGVTLAGNLTLGKLGTAEEPNGASANVSIATDVFTLAENKNLNILKGDFNLSTDKLVAGDGSQITGTGNLTLQQRGSSTDMHVVKQAQSAGKTGLVITNEQLNGGLFEKGFANLTLGKLNSSGKVYIDGVEIDNNVIIQNGDALNASEIIIGAGGLTVKNGNIVTLRGGKISNSNGSGVITALGAINFYTDDLSSLMGTNKVTGSGTLGIGTYKGDKEIYIGDGYAGTTPGLMLDSGMFDGSGVFSTGFSHYSFGSGTQDTIYVKGASFSKDVTLTGHNIVFEGDTNYATNAFSKILTINAFNKLNNGVTTYGSATQTGGVITADKLALAGVTGIGAGNYDLTFSENQIGTLAAEDVNQVRVKAKTLEIGTIIVPAGSSVGGSHGRTIQGITAGGNGTLPKDTNAIYLETTDEASSSALTINKALMANKGDITLISDTMTFNNYVQGKGVLTVQQAHDGKSMGVGGNKADGTLAAGKLQLGSNLFNGDERLFKEGFSQIILGRETGANEVTLNGTLDFVAPVIIRSAKVNDGKGSVSGGDSITINEDTKITTNDKDLEFITSTLITGEGSEIKTGSGNLTLTADNVDLRGKTYGSNYSNYLVLRTLSKGRDIYLGGDSAPADALWFQSSYFSDNGQEVFQPGYKNIIFGWADGTGSLYQGEVTFKDDVHILQGRDVVGGNGKVTVSGTIKTGGNNYTVESKNVEFKNADVNAEGGDVSLVADTLEFTGDNTIKSEKDGESGNLFITTYDVTRDIYFGDNLTIDAQGGLVLKNEWFNKGDKQVFKGSFDSITIGIGNNEPVDNKANIGRIIVGDITLNENLTQELILDNSTGSKGIEINKELNMPTGSLVINSGENITEGEYGVIKADNLIAKAKGAINLGNYGNSIKILKNISSLDGITIKNTGDLEIEGTINKGIGSDGVNIWTKGNLTMGTQGKVISNKGDVYLTAEATTATNGHFINTNNASTATDVIFVKTGRWIISTYDSVGDKYGSLMNTDTTVTGVAKFRNYGMGYGGKAAINSGQSGFIHDNQPTAVISAERVYGDADINFFTNGTLTLSVDNDNSERQAMDAPFISGMNSNLADSTNYEVGDAIEGTDTTPGANVNKLSDGTIIGGKHYGTDYLGEDEDPDYAITYTSANPLNYKVRVEFDITPRTVTLTANNDSKTYNGLEYYGGKGVTYDNLASWHQGNPLSGFKGSLIYGGTSQGAVNVGNYDIDISGSTLNSNNYNINYVPGTLTVNKRLVVVTADSVNKTYDGTSWLNGSVSYNGDGSDESGFVDSDEATRVITGAITYGGSSQGAVNANSNAYAIDISGDLSAQNYDFQYVDGTLTINKRKVQVTADSVSKTYDGNVWQNGSVSYSGIDGIAESGFVESDEATRVITGVITYGGDSQGAVNARNNAYAIDISGNLDAQNYDFQYVDGTLTINKKLVTVAAKDSTKVYDGQSFSINPSNYTYDGFIGGENEGNIGLGGSVELIGSANGAKDAGTYVIDIESDSTLSATNYDFEYKNGELIVEKRKLLVTAENDSKTYDGLGYSGNNIVNYSNIDGNSKSGFVTGENAGNIGIGGNINYASGSDKSQGAVNAGTYDIDISGSSLTSTNYDFVYADGTLTVDQRKVTITTGNTNKTYGDENPLFNGFTAEQAQAGSNTGLVGTESIGSVTNNYAGSIDKYTGAGQYDGVISSSNPIFSNGNASNYTFEFVNGNLTIDKATLTITADNARRAQNSDNPKFTVQYNGFKNNDDETSLTGLVVTTPATKESAPGSYDITPGSAWSNNYEIVFNPGELTVYPVGAVEDVKTINSNNQNNLPSGVNNPNNPTSGQNMGEPLITFDSPGSSPSNPAGENTLSNPAGENTPPALPPGTNVNIVSESNGSSSQMTFASEGSGFALYLGGNTGERTGEQGDTAQSKVSGAVPILFAKDGEQKLDAIYVINYNPDKLAVLPSTQGVTIPSLDEVIPDTNKGFSIEYRSSSAGAFEVSYGNGIVSIKPLDNKALEILTAEDKSASRAVLANGILVAIEDIGVVPDQIRAVYIFAEQ